MPLRPLPARVPDALLTQLNELAAARRRADPDVTLSHVVRLALERGIVALTDEGHGGGESEGERALASAKRARALAERAHYEAKKAVTAEAEVRKLTGNPSDTVPVTTLP